MVKLKYMVEFRAASCKIKFKKSEETRVLNSWEQLFSKIGVYIVASELKDPIWHSLEWQIGSFSSEATIYIYYLSRQLSAAIGGSVNTE